MLNAFISPTSSTWRFVATAFSAALCFISLQQTACAQTYKWVDASGKTVYSDTPPPAHAKKLISKTGESNDIVSNVKLPPDLAAAVNKNPVVFYSAPSCGPCNEARTMLKKNGVPFVEKTIKTNADIAKLKEVSGDTQIPLITINKSKFSGYDEIDWRTALTAGGYPETSILPKDYIYPDAEPAAPAPAPNAKKEEVNRKIVPVAPKSSSASGIRF